MITGDNLSDLWDYTRERNEIRTGAGKDPLWRMADPGCALLTFGEHHCAVLRRFNPETGLIAYRWEHQAGNDLRAEGGPHLRTSVEICEERIDAEVAKA